MKTLNNICYPEESDWMRTDQIERRILKEAIKVLSENVKHNNAILKIDDSSSPYKIVVPDCVNIATVVCNTANGDVRLIMPDNVDCCTLLIIRNKDGSGNRVTANGETLLSGGTLILQGDGEEFGIISRFKKLT